MAGNAGLGRPRGSKNKDTRELEDIAARVGVNPFEALCLILKGDKRKLGYDVPDIGMIPADWQLPLEMRIQAAKELCRYLYPQRKAVELTDIDGFKIIIEDYVSKK